MAEEDATPMDATAISPAVALNGLLSDDWLACSLVCPHRLPAMTTLVPRDPGLDQNVRDD
jgi:hypothetical protein